MSDWSAAMAVKENYEKWKKRRRRRRSDFSMCLHYLHGHRRDQRSILRRFPPRLVQMGGVSVALVDCVLLAG